MAHFLTPAHNKPLFDNNVPAYHGIRYQSFEELQQRYPDAIKKQRRGCVTGYFDIKFPFPLTSKRRDVVCSSLMYDPEKDQIMLLHKPFTAHGLNSTGVLDIFDFLYFRLRKLDENHTQFVQLHCYNLKGWTNSIALGNYLAFHRAKTFKKQCTRFLRQAQEGKIPAAPQDDYLYRLLLEQDIERQRAEHSVNRERESKEHHHNQK